MRRAPIASPSAKQWSPERRPVPKFGGQPRRLRILCGQRERVLDVNRLAVNHCTTHDRATRQGGQEVMRRDNHAAAISGAS